MSAARRLVTGYGRAPTGVRDWRMGTKRSIEVGFEWRQLPGYVSLRLTTEGRRHFADAAAKGEPLGLISREDVQAYSFERIRSQLKHGSPGIYLVEAFHTAPRPMPNAGSMSKADYHELVDHYSELDADPDYEPPSAQDPLWFYIGVSGDLRARFGQHEQKASGLRRAFAQSVDANDLEIVVSIQVNHTLRLSGQHHPPNLKSDLVRVLFEHAALADYREERPDTPMINEEALAEDLP
jgi:hypothetical protein